MNSVLEEIYATGRVRDAADNTHELHSHMSRDEGAAITRLLRAHDISRVVEVDLPTRTPSRSRRGMNMLGRGLPRSLSGLIFDDSLLRPDDDLGIAGSMAVLKKTAEDERSWDWFRPF